MTVMIWVLLCCLVGALASHYGRNGLLWGLLACLISPLFAGIILLIAVLLSSSSSRKQ